jgi:hypothetical protein
MDDRGRPKKTPMYEALNAARYQRQALIRAIQDRSGTPFIAYLSGPDALISRADTVYFNDLLYHLAPNTNLDMLLHTPGGDIDAAEKLMFIVRSRVGVGRLRVIVPDFAKSAGTLMAIGADEILMGNTSELGPIDPQITVTDAQGNSITTPVQSYLQAYKTLSQRLKDNAAQVLLGKLDPATVVLFEAVRTRARTFAENQLRQARNSGYTLVASKLIDGEKWPTHEYPINWEDATTIGINVTHLDPDDVRWEEYWRLYCLQRLAVKDGEKLFESEHASSISPSLGSGN